jgi:2-acylglycerol O-acyltransferase 2
MVFSYVEMKDRVYEDQGILLMNQSNSGEEKVNASLNLINVGTGMIVFLLMAVPVSHVYATICIMADKKSSGVHRKKKDMWKRVLQAGARLPHAGGIRTLLFQILSWSLWAFSLSLYFNMINIANKEVDQVAFALTLFAATLSLAFMAKSILLFDPAHATKTKEWDVRCLPSKMTASYIVVILGLLWAVVAVGLLRVAPIGTPLGTLYSILSVVFFVLSACTIHGLGGLLRYWFSSMRLAPEENNEYKSMDILNHPDAAQSHSLESELMQNEWKFFQPFKGGAAFVATQAAGWILFSVALLPLVWSMALAISSTAHWIHSMTIAAGITALLAELLLAFSLLFFNRKSVNYEMMNLSSCIQHIACISILYIPAHVTLAFIISTFFLVHPTTAAFGWMVVLPVYYSLTGYGTAEKTGHREWPMFRNWLGEQAERVLPYWFGFLDVKVEEGAVFSREQKYVFGYLPHGLYPLGAAYLPILPSFRKLLPGVHPPTLSASIVFQIPFMRDLLLWTGLREVTRKTFIRTLKERRSLVVVPGGQAELVETHKFAEQKCALYTGHKGFVRLALQEGAHLTPILVFGEVTSLRNFVDTPTLHRWTYKILGFPLPYIIGGKLGVLPFPSREGLRFVIGTPLEPPATYRQGSVPTEEEVSEYHRNFYLKSKEMWNTHKKDFQGYENIDAVLV